MSSPGSEISESILSRIGNTRLLELKGFSPADHARILIKLEDENPTASMKDRMALAMIEAAENDGRLQAGGRVVEYTAGSTGVSLSFICKVKKYPLDLVSSDAFSDEKLRHMAAFGAEMTIIKSDGGRMDANLTNNMVKAAARIRDQKGSFWTDQLNNEDQLTAYHRMGEEIWRQTKGRVDAFVQSVGTGASLRGNAEVLRSHHPDIRIVAVEPAESAVLSGDPPGAHKVEGVGAGFVVPLWKAELVNRILKVSTEDSMAMCRTLAQTMGLFAGTSTGGNLVAALEVARELGPNATVVTIMCDSGIKYLSTNLYG